MPETELYVVGEGHLQKELMKLKQNDKNLGSNNVIKNIIITNVKDDYNNTNKIIGELMVVFEDKKLSTKLSDTN